VGNFIIKMFPASYGDSFLVQCSGKKNTNILIDMGFMSTYNHAIKKEVMKLNELGEVISLLVFTHIDDDHILGGIKFLEENGNLEFPKIIKVEEVWHNSYRHLQFKKKNTDMNTRFHNEEEEKILTDIIKKGYIREKGANQVNDISYLKGSTLSGLLFKYGYSEIWNKSFSNQAVVLKDNNLPVITLNEEVKITLLSPDNEKLEKLDLEWENKLKELGFSEKVVSSALMDDAFEIYNSGLTEKKKREKKINQISGQQINLDQLSNEENNIDTSVVNGSSISFLLEFNKKKVLFLGDSHPDIITRNIKKIIEKIGGEKLVVDAMKVSHHGSKHNTTKELLDLITTNKYLISTNGRGRGFTHPDIETISRIISSNVSIEKQLIFNFKPNHIFKHIEDTDLKDKYNYSLRYSNDASVSLINEITTIKI
jgi:beta-lactamase superfamily II metal-dependent hydrolase